MTTQAATSFPGYGEDAPLDGVPGASAVFVRRLADGTLSAWSAAMAATGNCAHPVRLTGSSVTADAATGEVLSAFDTASSPLGVLYRACGNRRESVCPACSRVYGRDTFEMIRTGVLGGKTVPDTVADNPLLFATFTAPSFGLVHGTRTNHGACRPRRAADRRTCEHGRPMWCPVRHHDDGSDAAVGQPLCGDCYDYLTQVVWQWHAPELWRRTTIALRRHVAAALGVPATPPKKGGLSLRDVASVEYARVAEYQARGVVHFHALIRLDGPHGPGSPSPLTGDQVEAIIRTAARSVAYVAAPTFETDTVRRLAWGTQLDIRVVRQGDRTDDRDGPITPDQVAAYLAKYATKDATSSATQNSAHTVRLRVACQDIADAARTRTRWRRDGTGTVIAPDAGTIVDPQATRESAEKTRTITDPYELMGKWVHMLGFRGHFSTKSRRYSITLGRLRRARARFQALAADAARRGEVMDTRDLEARLLADDHEATTVVVGSFEYAGSGWHDDTEQALALAAAARAREYAQWKASQ